MANKYRFRCVGFFDLLIMQYEKLRIAHDGVPFKSEHMTMNASIIMDPVYSFFIYCHHIEDRIIKDDLIDSSVKKKAASFAENTKCLKHCAVIANRIKHLKIPNTRRKSLPKFINVERKIISDKPIDATKIDSPEYRDVIVKDFVYIETDEGIIEVFDLATQCVEAWRRFIEDNISKL